VTFEVRNEAGELVSGTAKILDDQRTDEPQYAELLIGWEADELQHEGGVLNAKVRFLNSVEEATGWAILTVSDASAVLTEPDFQFRAWNHVVVDRGALLECGTGAPHAFGSELAEFDQNLLELPTRMAPIAVAWKYTLEPTPETGPADPLPLRFFILGPSSTPVGHLELAFEGPRSEHCIQITARDLRTDLEYSETICSEPGPTTAIDNSDAIAACRFEDLPPGDEYRERWCRAHDDQPPECQPIVEGTAGSPGDPDQPPTLGDDEEKAHRTSQACALTMPPRPTACDAAALWSFALFLVARARRRKTHRPD
jgi:hypothetical protein